VCSRASAPIRALLLAGAVAYYALLSLVPLLILVMIVRFHAIDPERLLSVLTEYSRSSSSADRMSGCASDG
jgi:uncharacterized BrkB/YihY/UPF0761 family membrane protein